MEQEMVSIPVGNAPGFLQLRDNYKQQLVEDTRFTKPRIWPPNNMCSWPVILPMHGNDLN